MRRTLMVTGSGAFTPGLRPSSSLSTTKDAGNPTFNFACLTENVVKSGSTYYSPYTVGTEGDIRLATASDRDGPWSAGSVILAESAVTWRGTARLYSPHLLEDAGTWYLFYSAVVAGGGTDSLNAIGYATASSVTGPYTDHGSAVLSPAAAGAWDSRRVGEPAVMVVGGTWIMAYMGEDSDIAYQESEQIGVATASSPSGTWTRAGGNPLLAFGAGGSWDDSLLADPDIQYTNGYYWIMYAGGPDSTPTTRADQGMAYASDPTGPWTKHPDNPILSVGAGGSWDDVWAFRGGLWLEDGEWGGVYAGYDGANYKGGNFRLTVTN